jgi:hypothetical protein
MAVRSRKKKNVIPEGTSEELALFKALCDAFQELGTEVRIEKGDFRGGLCVVDGEKEMIFLNKKHTLDSRINTLIDELAKRDSLLALGDVLQEKINDWQKVRK